MMNPSPQLLIVTVVVAALLYGSPLIALYTFTEKGESCRFSSVLAVSVICFAIMATDISYNIPLLKTALIPIGLLCPKWWL